MPHTMANILYLTPPQEDLVTPRNLVMQQNLVTQQELVMPLQEDLVTPQQNLLMPQNLVTPPQQDIADYKVKEENQTSKFNFIPESYYKPIDSLSLEELYVKVWSQVIMDNIVDQVYREVENETVDQDLYFIEVFLLYAQRQVKVVLMKLNADEVYFSYASKHTYDDTDKNVELLPVEDIYGNIYETEYNGNCEGKEKKIKIVPKLYSANFLSFDEDNPTFYEECIALFSSSSVAYVNPKTGKLKEIFHAPFTSGWNVKKSELPRINTEVLERWTKLYKNHVGQLIDPHLPPVIVGCILSFIFPRACDVRELQLSLNEREEELRRRFDLARR